MNEMNEMDGAAAHDILVVDDDRTTLGVLGSTLRTFGHNPVVTTRSTDIFGLLEGHDFDLILMDVFMPELDGLTILRQLNGHKKYSNIPVIMLTGSTEEGILRKCFDSGAADFTTKPVKKDVLRARVNTALKTKVHITQLRELNERMNRFIAIVSHDLRGPIGGLHSMCKILAESPNCLHEFVHDMEATTARMMTLVSDLLDITAIESGNIRMNYMPCDFTKLVGAAIGEMRFAADRKGISLVNDAKHFALVKADPDRIMQVLNNLLVNAVKFTPQAGEVTVSATYTNKGLRVRVSDTGVGIHAADIPKLFSKHERTSTVGTSGEQGTGFGLPLVRETINAHGSSIEVESNVGEGTSFSFTLQWYPPGG